MRNRKLQLSNQTEINTPPVLDCSLEKRQIKMKCTLHPYECGVGICASCLRERLLALNATSPDNQQILSPPCDPFPRSVSPYVPRAAVDAGSQRSSSFLSIFFGRHWLPRILRFRRKKKTAADGPAAATRWDRGMSAQSSSGVWPEVGGRSSVESPYRSWRPKPHPTKAATTTHKYHQVVGDISGFSVCCSPLSAVSVSQERLWAAGIRFHGDMRGAEFRPRHRRRASTGG